jgi:hypothetical protein
MFEPELLGSSGIITFPELSECPIFAEIREYENLARPVSRLP